MQESAARCSHRHYRHAGRCHHPLRRRCPRADGTGPLATADGRCSPGGEYAAPMLYLHNHSETLHWVQLVVLFGALLGMISSILVFQIGQARVWFAMSRDGLLPSLFSRCIRASAPPQLPPGLPAYFVGAARRAAGYRNVRRSLQHRHPVRVRAGLRRSSSSFATKSRIAIALSAVPAAPSFPL